MIQVTPQMRVLVAVEAVDFRRGIDGLARVVREQLSADPFSGCVFVFRNRAATAVKLLVFDGQGYWLAHNQQASHYTSFDSRRGSWLLLLPDAWIAAARSLSRSQRLQCFMGRVCGSS